MELIDFYLCFSRFDSPDSLIRNPLVTEYTWNTIQETFNKVTYRSDSLIVETSFGRNIHLLLQIVDSFIN